LPQVSEHHSQLCRVRSGEHVDRIVCEFSQRDAGRRRGRGAVVVNPDILDDKPAGHRR
jgi:hypothetical protein